MKALIIIFSLITSLTCFSQEDGIVWQDSIHYDFGDLKLNEPSSHDFIFHNKTGKSISIDNVRTTCTCTDTEWTGGIIPAGGDGKVRAIFNSHQLGYFNKKLKVYFKDIKGATILRVEGNVE